MQKDASIFRNNGGTAEALAEEIAERVLIPIPACCVEGVATNAWLIQHHVDILRGLDFDGR